VRLSASGSTDGAMSLERVDSDTVLARAEGLARDSPHVRSLLLRDVEARGKGIAAVLRWLEEDPANVQDWHPTLVYLAAEAPLADVREAFSTVVRLESIVPRSPSLFIDSSLFDQPAPETVGVLAESFFSSGRVLDMQRVMGLHPGYLDVHQRTLNVIVYGSAPLPLPWRMYILLMAGAQLNSHYVVELYQTEFLQNGGDPSWLLGGEPRSAKAAETSSGAGSVEPGSVVGDCRSYTRAIQRRSG